VTERRQLCSQRATVIHHDGDIISLNWKLTFAVAASLLEIHQGAGGENHSLRVATFPSLLFSLYTHFSYIVETASGCAQMVAADAKYALFSAAYAKHRSDRNYTLCAGLSK
jgi:hypothetical protein